ncbi:MAG: hypothetical protein QXG40_06515 [Ignisphaera sp.]
MSYIEAILNRRTRGIVDKDELVAENVIKQSDIIVQKADPRIRSGGGSKLFDDIYWVVVKKG